MRVSIPICIASSVVVVVLSWWLTTRKHDFMTGPTPTQLENIRIAAAQTNPTAQGLGNALSPSSPDQQQSPIPVILPEHVKRAPQLEDFRKEANLGADYLIELAELLKEEHAERALTCWERVIDSTKATAEQRERASRNIRQLKKTLPLWNEQPEDGIIVVIHAGTGPTTAALLKPVLEETAAFLQQASSGVITIETQVTAGEQDLVDEGEAPVAIWMSGPLETSASTDIVSFSTAVDSIDGMQEKVSREIYRIIRHHLKQMDDFQPLPEPAGRNSPHKLLEGWITRMVWKYYAESLQTAL